MSESDKIFYVDVSPEMQLYKILQKQSYDLESALAEFVDNSVQAFSDKEKDIKQLDSKNAKLKVTIIVDTKARSICIKDTASGISKGSFQRAIRMGHGDGYSHHGTSLSVYGIGMKSAAIWFSDTWEVETVAIGSSEKLNTSFDLNSLLLSNKNRIEVQSNSDGISPKEHYTEILITNTFRKLDEDYFKNKVLPFLLETFFKFDFLELEIIFDNIILTTNEAFLDMPEPLIYPPVDKNGNEIEGEKPVIWKKRINIDYAGRKVEGFIMIMNEGRYSQPGIRLLRNKRVIRGISGKDQEKRNVPTSLYQTSNKYAAQRIYGELHLDQFPVNFMKTGFDEDLENLYRLLHAELKNKDNIPNYISQSEYYRVKKAKSKQQQNNSGASKDKLITDKTNNSSNNSKIKDEKTPENIEFSDELFKAFEVLDSRKLSRFYKSLCRVSLTKDPILAYVGAWTLLESLKNFLAKNDNDKNSAFPSFFGRFLNQKITDRTEKKGYTHALEEIGEKGNLNKHNAQYHTINAQQLAEDFKLLEPIIVDIININTD